MGSRLDAKARQRLCRNTTLGRPHVHLSGWTMCALWLSFHHVERRMPWRLKVVKITDDEEYLFMDGQLDAKATRRVCHDTTLGRLHVHLSGWIMCALRQVAAALEAEQRQLWSSKVVDLFLIVEIRQQHGKRRLSRRGCMLPRLSSARVLLGMKMWSCRWSLCVREGGGRHKRRILIGTAVDVKPLR